MGQTEDQKVVPSDTKDQKAVASHPAEQKVEDSQTKDQKVEKLQTDQKVALSQPFVPGYVEREDTTDSEVENAPDSIESNKKEEIRFDKATLIKSINDAASRKVKETTKEEDKTPEKSASSGKTAEERKKILLDMKEK